MVGAPFWLTVGAAAAVAIAVVVYALVFARAREIGSSGVVMRSRLDCPKCHRTFDYDWIPGASFSAVRLGTSRYMACPLCGRWSVFPIYRTMVPRPAGGVREPAIESPGTPPG